ncbi:MAG: alanine racemase [Thiobacillus sp. 63-78]|uniref:alanine racemase n=1 Tax=Thiobacillus sp. 63-78 TaxID=1895859 RepID=UPI00086C4EE6|nr:alanine racemase [Thiobacillus sp. 63-78]MBN8762253.1 alanine racemase [Thiobacillus sp.]ODV13850.1 MAG: alanine racemase [Thiobacillus sp. SCN 64-317]MBN8766875.1 alanine racemase [Thiobacillus sp.]MBN8774653.1 alanine racemase [Thiobacillus sp.]OJZ12858.1 MAG: alanine racemase [Thiobacillus sp. 63-78]
MRPIQARISIGAMAHNLRVARSHAAGARIFSVVKANAYGHGLSRARRALAATDGFAVLTLEEAANLRLMGVDQPILLLEGLFGADEIAACVELDLWPVLHHPAHLDWLRQQPPSRPLRVFLKFDSGMHRLGFPLADHAAIIARTKSLVGVAGITLMTHFSQADETAGVGWQLQPFLRELAAYGLPWSSANSAALLRYPETLGAWARPGLMLYGASPFADMSAGQLGLKPAMTLQSEIIAVQTLQAGEGVGYGQLFRADRSMRVGVVACGYADGYPRHAQTGTPVLVDGRNSRILGRVSMDMLCVDLSECPEAGVGSPVVLWGEKLSVDAVAAAAGTSSYELLCALAARVPVEETD